MGLRLYPTAGVLETVYLPCDEALASANDAETLTAYMASGDASALVIPDDATRVVVRTLSPSERAHAHVHAAAESGTLGIFDGRPDTERALTDAERASLVEQAGAHNLRVCELAVESVSAMPDVEAAQVGPRRLYPRDALLRLEPLALREIAEHVARMSEPSADFSQASGPECGAPGAESGIASPAEMTSNSGTSEGDAAA